jgi:hypothetical protein
MMDPTYTGAKIEARGNLDSHIADSHIADSHVAPVPRELELEDQGEEGHAPLTGCYQIPLSDHGRSSP